MARSIEVQEFPATQARIKAAQRVGVVLLLVLLAAALAGASRIFRVFMAFAPECRSGAGTMHPIR